MSCDTSWFWFARRPLGFHEGGFTLHIVKVNKVYLIDLIYTRGDGSDIPCVSCNMLVLCLIYWIWFTFSFCHIFLFVFLFSFFFKFFLKIYKLKVDFVMDLIYTRCPEVMGQLSQSFILFLFVFLLQVKKVLCLLFLWVDLHETCWISYPKFDLCWQIWCTPEVKNQLSR